MHQAAFRTLVEKRPVAGGSGMARDRIVGVVAWGRAAQWRAAPPERVRPSARTSGRPGSGLTSARAGNGTTVASVVV